MALLPEFDWRVTPADLIPTEMLKLTNEEQIERWDTFQTDIGDFFQSLAAFRSPFTVSLIAPSTPAVFTNAPSGGPAEWAGSPAWRAALDLTNLSEARFCAEVMVAGAGTASIAVQFSANSGGSWQALDGGAGPAVNIDTVGLKTSAWQPMSTGAQADVQIRLVHLAGDNVTDPALGLVVVQFR